MAKPIDAIYEPGKRAMIKVKHARTADCVVAGFRWHKSGDDKVGSLLLGLYDDRGRLQHVGVTSAFTMAVRKQLAEELAPLRVNALDGHPWRDWAEAPPRVLSQCPAAQSRWSAGKDLSWEPLRIERVCEVKYDHLQGDRFRHATIFLRWRPDKPPADCRYDQLEVTTPYELAKVFGAASAAAISLLTSSSRSADPRSGSSASCAGRSASGTCWRLTRIRVHVVEAAAHRVDEHVGGLEVRRRLRMPRLPALEAGQRILLLPARAADLDQRAWRRRVDAGPPARSGLRRARDADGSPACLR